MASKNAPNRQQTNRAAGSFRLAKYGIGALATASVANVLVLYSSLAVIDVPPAFVGGPFGPLAVGPVVLNSAVAAVGATLVYGAIARFASRPNRPFVGVAGVALVLSFAMFLAPDIAGAPLEVFAVLAVMHLVAAIVIVGVLTRATTAEVASR